MRPRILLLALVLLGGALAGCTQGPPAGSASDDAPLPDASPAAGSCVEQARAKAAAAPSDRAGRGEVTLLTHDSFNVERATLDAFTNATGYAVRLVKMGDAGEALNKAILQKDAPLGDVLFGVDNALIHRADAAGLFRPYESPRLEGVEDRLLGPFCRGGRMLATPIDYGYVQLNHDLAWFGSRGIPLPKDLKDVANATYAPLTVVTNPYTSSPGFAFLLATVDRFGEEGDYTYKTWWSDFVANGGKVVSGWEQAYGDEFTQGWTEGAARDRPLVLSYSTSPAYSVMIGATKEAVTGNVDVPKGAWFQVEAAGILANARNVEGARALLDFMLDPAFQEDAAASMVVHPVHRDATPPAAYARHAPEPSAPASLAPETVDAKRDAWLAGWRQATGQA